MNQTDRKKINWHLEHIELHLKEIKEWIER